MAVVTTMTAAITIEVAAMIALVATDRGGSQGDCHQIIKWLHFSVIEVTPQLKRTEIGQTRICPISVQSFLDRVWTIWTDSGQMKLALDRCWSK